MQFKAKLRKIGNSQGIYIPKKVITGYNLGDMIELQVITGDEEDKQEVITKPLKDKKPFTFNFEKGIYE